MTPRLKSIEVNGFKTFASKFKFEFPVEITAIVGPNGSGKSNVADAIRWVLGEQSFTLLRGRKTEDMIFSGSKTRPRAGMAMVTINLNNEDNWLPIEYSEVSITRRAYRDGQNEYLLNGQKVRLKEINELLSNSGLAQRTYNIIGQGLVDSALSLKPNDRIQFFEEAAGIGLYRKRRKETISRLETTRRNVERISDILSELTPRLKNLEKQSQKVSVFEQIKKDLEILLREWYGYHWHLKQTELTSIRQTLEEHEKKLSETRENKTKIDGKVEVNRETIKNIRNNLNEYHNRSALEHEKREKISREIAVFIERKKALEEKEHRLQRSLDLLVEEIKTKSQRLEEKIKENEEKEIELNEVLDRKKFAETQLNIKQSEFDKIREEINSTQREIDRLRKNEIEKTARKNELNNRIGSIEASLVDIRTRIAEEEKEVNQQTSKVNIEQKKLDELKEILENLKKEIQEVNVLSSNNKTEISTIEKGISVDESLLFKLNSELRTIEEQEKSLSGLNQGPKEILNLANSGKIPGSYKSLMENMEIPADYEKAVGSVLDEYVDSVAFFDEEVPEEVFIHTKQKKPGKVILISTSRIKQSKVLNVSKSEGVLGNAYESLNVPSQIDQVIKFLLGNVIIVESRKYVKKVWESASDAVVVTLDGDVFYPNGILKTGVTIKNTLLERPRRKRELNSEIEKVESIIAEKKKQLETLMAKQVSIEAKLKTFANQKDKTENEFQAQRRVINQLTLDLQKLTQSIQYNQNRAEELDKQFESTKNEITSINNEIKQIAAVTQEKISEIKESRNKISAQEIEQLRAELNSWDIQFNLVKTETNSIQQIVNSLKSEISTVEDRKVNVEDDISDADSDLEKTNMSLENLSNQETEINKEIKNLAELIQPSEEKLKASENEIGIDQEKQNQIQKELSIFERYTTQAQMELARKREQIENLKEKIEDDFGLVMYEYTADVSGPTPLPIEGMVNELPIVKEIQPELEENLNRQRAQLRRLGAVNPDAIQEFTEVKERHQFLLAQMEDLKEADDDLMSVIQELDEIIQLEFEKTFTKVAEEFSRMFTRLFGGGSASLFMVDSENPTEGGVEIEATLPGRRRQNLAMLSGGERSLTAVALIFSLLKVSPTPFCVLDEVDAALDEANVGRFSELLKELGKNSQFIVITHNRNTVQISDVIYGVTMGRDSSSQIVSLKLEEVSQDMVE